MSAQTSAGRRQSIEVEYWVIDERGRLTAPGDLVKATPGAEREFVEPLLEIKTTPCESTAAVREELVGRIQSVLERAEELGKRLVPLATPLHHGDIADLPSERTRVQDQIVGEDFEYVRHCAGTHIHFEQQPGREVAQFNTLVALDPALALVNSAPHYRGERVAAGARSELYRRLAYEGLPHQGRLWPYVDSKSEWTRRLERRYEEFETAALAAGVERRTVRAHFDPESAVWTPVQFRETFGTVEWRSPDTALPSQITRLAGDVAGVLDRTADSEVCINCDPDEETVVLPSFDTVLEHVDRAIETGLASEAVQSYLDSMGFAVDAYEPLSAELQDTEPVTSEHARELRLEYAERLEEDVRQTLPASSD